MSCRRANEIDLLAFTVDRNDPEWASFRAHYPTCPECSRAVAGVGALVAGLAARGSGDAHPDDDHLLDYEAGTLGTAERSRIDVHLAGCAACRTELGVLRGFAPETARASSAADERAVDANSRTVGWMDRLLVWLRPGPVFAFSTAAMLALVIAWWSVRPDAVENTGPPLAEHTQPPTSADDGRTTPPIDEAATPEVDEQTPPLLAERPDVLPSPEPESTPQLAERSDAPPPTPEPTAVPETAPDAAPDAAPRTSGEREIVLLAAHFPSEMPRYVDPPGLGGSDLDALRSSVIVRGEGSDRPELSVLAPEHVGITRLAAPRLYWAVDRAIAGAVEIVVNDPEADVPALSKRIPGPIAAGIHVIDLAAEGVTLREGRDYEWSVAIPATDATRDQDVVSLAVVRRIAAVDSSEPDGAGERETSDEAARARRVHDLAASGDWYDAFDQTHRWLEQAPDVDRLRDYRRVLLEQVELGGVTPWIDGSGGGNR